MSSVQLPQFGLSRPSFELASVAPDTKDTLSSTPRRLPHPPSQQALGITPTHKNVSLRQSGKAYSVIVAVASPDPDPEHYLRGVESDLSFVFDELKARSTNPPRVITDVICESLESRAQVLPAKLQYLKSSIEEMGQVLKPGDVCYVYIGGHIEIESDEISFMPLSDGERLYGNAFASWLRNAAGGGGTIIVMADICHSSAFLRMPNIYEINADGLFSYPMIGGNEHDNVRGELIVVSSTECGQLALTIEIKDEVYPGWHGFFTWLLFKYFRENSPQIDIEKLLLYLRRECALHPQKPRPQVSATTENLRQLPIRMKSA